MGSFIFLSYNLLSKDLEKGYYVSTVLPQLPLVHQILLVKALSTNIVMHCGEPFWSQMNEEKVAFLVLFLISQLAISTQHRNKSSHCLQLTL